MLSCMVFVVAALIEFALVVVISRSSTAMNRKLKGLSSVSNQENRREITAAGEPRRCWEQGQNISDISEIKGEEEQDSNSTRRLIAYIVPHINNIDIVSFWAYLFIFVLFNCIYWPAYLKREIAQD